MERYEKYTKQKPEKESVVLTTIHSAGKSNTHIDKDTYYAKQYQYVVKVKN